MHTFTPIDHLIVQGQSPSGPERQEFSISKQNREHTVLEEVIEHQPHHEVTEVMEVHRDVVSVPEDLQSIGVQSTGAIQFATTQPVNLPLNDDTIVVGLKAPFSSSLRWLAEFCVYLLKRAHIHIKNIHGRIMRIPENSTESTAKT